MAATDPKGHPYLVSRLASLKLGASNMTSQEILDDLLATVLIAKYIRARDHSGQPN